MRRSARRFAGIVVSGVTVVGLGVAGITAAHADEREKVDQVNCGSDCTDIEYIENVGNAYFGEKQTIGSDVKTCPGAQKSTATATFTKTTGRSWSWSAGGDFNNKFLSTAGAKVAGSFSRTLSESVANSTGATEPIPDGHIGHMTFTQRMYHSEGVMNWTEQFFDEFHSSATFTADVSSETPMTIDNGTADGVYDVDSRPMNADELTRFC